MKFFDGQEVVEPKKSGPPNRMNDLAYGDWMKFQKSFFRYAGDQRLISENINFFTKRVWEDGTPSRSLLIADSEVDEQSYSPRHVEVNHTAEGFFQTTTLLLSKSSKLYDFVLLDLRPITTSLEDIRDFELHARDFFWL